MANHLTLGKRIAISKKLQRVLERIPERVQDRIADQLAAIMAKDDADWSAAFAKSMGKLEKLKNEALDAYASGETKILDPEKL